MDYHDYIFIFVLYIINNIYSMSNPTTYYCVGSVDLSNIFQPLLFGKQITYDTNYNVPRYGDLKNIFAAYTGDKKADLTNYNVSGYGDLNNVFAKYNLLYILDGSYNIQTNVNINDSIYDTYIEFTSGLGSIIINKSNITINYFIVGGGGNGGITHRLVSVPEDKITSLGGGGGGGQVISGNLVALSGQTYSLSVGNNIQSSNFNSIISNSGGTAYSSSPTDPYENSSTGAKSGNNYSGGAEGVYSVDILNPPGTNRTFIGGGGGGNNGAGSPGGNDSNKIGGAGGDGYPITINGSTIMYGKGGGGDNGGISGGGPNTGGGGCGADSEPLNAGSSGVVILYFNIN